jgi:hypothetical protein
MFRGKGRQSKTVAREHARLQRYVQHFGQAKLTRKNASTFAASGGQFALFGVVRGRTLQTTESAR